jgi:trehalose/maltose hydrolase-like predicted phosphorylase
MKHCREPRISSSLGNANSKITYPEYANNVDNGAFTIASAAELLRHANALRVAQGLPINDTWQTQWENIAYPSAPSNITLEYQTMNDSVAVKQADVVLLTYPLDYGEDYTADDKLLDLDYVGVPTILEDLQKLITFSMPISSRQTAQR